MHSHDAAARHQIQSTCLKGDLRCPRWLRKRGLSWRCDRSPALHARVARTVRVSDMAALVELERGYGAAHDGDETVEIVTIVRLAGDRAPLWR